MTHRIGPYLVTLSDPYGNSSMPQLFKVNDTEGLFSCDFSHIYATANKTSTDIKRRAVPLRQLSLLCGLLCRVTEQW